MTVVAPKHPNSKACYVRSSINHMLQQAGHKIFNILEAKEAKDQTDIYEKRNRYISLTAKNTAFLRGIIYCCQHEQLNMGYHNEINPFNISP